MNRNYRFSAGLVEEEDGRWSAWLNEIPWCTTFGDSKEDALLELHDAASVAVQALEQEGEVIPQCEVQLLVEVDSLV